MYIKYSRLKYFFLLLFVGLLFGCGSGLQTKDPVFFRGLPGLANWIVLPFTSKNINFDDHFMLQLERILKVQLPSFGISTSEMFSKKNHGILQQNNGSDATDTSLQIAKEQGFSFAITGEVKNWKTYTTSNKTLELSLTVYNLETLKPVWYVNGRKESINDTELLQVYRLLVIDLLKLMPIADYK